MSSIEKNNFVEIISPYLPLGFYFGVPATFVFWWIFDEYKKITKKRDPFKKVLSLLDKKEKQFDGLRELKVYTDKKGILKLIIRG
jgi:hypothetical protein